MITLAVMNDKRYVRCLRSRPCGWPDLVGVCGSAVLLTRVVNGTHWTHTGGAMIYQHAAEDRDRELAERIGVEFAELMAARGADVVAIMRAG
jgi:hypothetical protein